MRHSRDGIWRILYIPKGKKRMRTIVTAAEMKYYDNDTIENKKIPSLLLMERAALELVRALTPRITKKTKVVVFAGNGNNGGDALAAGRILSEQGVQVSFFMPGNSDKVSKETKKQIEILQNLGFSIHDNFDLKEYDIMSAKEKQAPLKEAFGFLAPLTSKSSAMQMKPCESRDLRVCDTDIASAKEKQAPLKEAFGFQGSLIVIDGLFGIGLTRPIEGVWKQAVKQINQLKELGAYLVSADIPSGICADTGNVLGCAVKADLTVTFAYAKAGHYYYPGREYTGKLQICPIGIVGEQAAGLEASYQEMEEEDVEELLPKRVPFGNKGTFGKVLLLAGSLNMCGAAILCGKAILRTGAGMVKIITPEENREILQKALPEAMLSVYQKVPDMTELKACIAWADVLAAGPGIGTGEASYFALSCLLEQRKKPMVIDADALNLIAASKTLQQAVKDYEQNKIIMTPHPGEFVRLSGMTMEAYQANPYQAVKQQADAFSCIMVGKDAITLVARPNEKKVSMNLTGNDGMATAGSGDVLTGIIGGLLAQKMETDKAAMLGVYLHGRAGERAAKAESRYGVMASDMIEYLW